MSRRAYNFDQWRKDFATAFAADVPLDAVNTQARASLLAADNDEPDEPIPLLPHRTRMRQLEEAKDAIRLAGIHSELELLRLLECICANCDAGKFTTPSFVDDLAEICSDIEDDITALQAEVQALDYNGSERGELDAFAQRSNRG